MYDLIGDIHGHADELIQLLETLGYGVRGLSSSGGSCSVSLHPHEVLVAQLLFAVPAIVAQEPALGNAEIQAGHVLARTSGRLAESQ